MRRQQSNPKRKGPINLKCDNEPDKEGTLIEPTANVRFEWLRRGG